MSGGKTVEKILEKTLLEKTPAKVFAELSTGAVEKAFKNAIAGIEAEVNKVNHGIHAQEIVEFHQIKEKQSNRTLQNLLKRVQQEGPEAIITEKSTYVPKKRNRIGTNTAANKIEGLHPKRKISLKASTFFSDEFGSSWLGLTDDILLRDDYIRSRVFGYIQDQATTLTSPYGQTAQQALSENTDYSNYPVPTNHYANRLTGMRHGSLSGTMRSLYTDFGSGYKGLIEALMKQEKLMGPVIRHLFPEAEEVVFQKAVEGNLAKYSWSAMKEGKSIFSASRTIDQEKKVVNLVNVFVDEAYRGGRYSRYAQAEKDLFQLSGLSGWSMESNTVNPITMKKYQNLYNAISPVEGSSFLEGTIPHKSEDAIIQQGLRKLEMAKNQKAGHMLSSTNGLLGGKGHIASTNKGPI
jgi:hypothetical protein